MHPSPARTTPLRYWLGSCLALIVLMVLIGGLTRLTESGLSIVEWKLFSGILPPMSAQGWEHEFSAYQTSPEFQKVNSSFALADFKRIFWLEYIHRVLGRIIGLALVVPFAYFASRRMLRGPLLARMFIACLLVAAQGTVGWIMVASGLVDAPRVAPLKLAMHLGLALTLYCWLLWTFWQIGAPRPVSLRSSGRMALVGLIGLAALQILLGALVAGLDAGYSYNSFPLMDGQFFPAHLHRMQPWWLNHLESILTVQFQHRMGAYSLVIALVMFSAWQWKAATLPQKKLLKLLLAVVFAQFVLGVATLLSVMDIALASAHQLGAVLLLSVLLRLLWFYPPAKAAN